MVPPDHEDPVVFDRSLQASLSAGSGGAGPAWREARPARLDRSGSAAFAVRAVRRVRGTDPRTDGDAGAATVVPAELGGQLAPPARSGSLMADLPGISLR